ncbi:hypothetical protein HK098_003585 [Nowakowskiella sp. JEL0407]|nr:hypothetical protein HK098_003585 [Nowakowskiella sp. JEL0407]
MSSRTSTTDCAIHPDKFYSCFASEMRQNTQQPIRIYDPSREWDIQPAVLGKLRNRLEDLHRIDKDPVLFRNVSISDLSNTTEFAIQNLVFKRWIWVENEISIVKVLTKFNLFNSQRKSPPFGEIAENFEYFGLEKLVKFTQLLKSYFYETKLNRLISLARDINEASCKEAYHESIKEIFTHSMPILKEWVVISLIFSRQNVCIPFSNLIAKLKRDTIEVNELEYFHQDSKSFMQRFWSDNFNDHLKFLWATLCSILLQHDENEEEIDFQTLCKKDNPVGRESMVENGQWQTQQVQPADGEVSTRKRELEHISKWIHRIRIRRRNEISHVLELQFCELYQQLKHSADDSSQAVGLCDDCRDEFRRYKMVYLGEATEVVWKLRCRISDLIISHESLNARKDALKREWKSALKLDGILESLSENMCVKY